MYPGQYSSSPGINDCSFCAAGTYSSVSGTISCINCPAGTYIDYDGAMQCYTCGVNTYSALPGSISCTDCDDGYNQCTPGQTKCNPCPRNYCGACQFDDRDMCFQFDGICWNDNTDPCELNPTITTDCLSAIAETCYGIWTDTGEAKILNA